MENQGLSTDHEMTLSSAKIVFILDNRFYAYPKF